MQHFKVRREIIDHTFRVGVHCHVNLRAPELTCLKCRREKCNVTLRQAIRQLSLTLFVHSNVQGGGMQHIMVRRIGQICHSGKVSISIRSQNITNADTEGAHSSAFLQSSPAHISGLSSRRFAGFQRPPQWHTPILIITNNPR